MIKQTLLSVLACGAIFISLHAPGAVLYVASGSQEPLPPYTSWSNAAVSIQDAVDAATAGDQILVSNGVYQTGGRVVFGAMTNRVVVDKPLIVQSVNGPSVTLIQGFQVPPGSTNADNAVRCVYLASGALLTGFTVTNGATRASGDYVNEQTGGGILCESASATVSNTVVSGNSAGYAGGGVSGGTLNNCLFSRNNAGIGGGAFSTVLNNCTLTANQAGYGGGASYATLNDCMVVSNVAANGGGGTIVCLLSNSTLCGNSAVNLGYGGASSHDTLIDCTIMSNSTTFGGGVYLSTLTNCTLVGNSASSTGGGASYGTLQNCYVFANSAHYGGAGEYSTFNDSILSGNYADYNGGGAYYCTVNRCIVSGSWSNTGGGAAGGTLNNCQLISNSAIAAAGAYEGILNSCLVASNSATYYGGGTVSTTLNDCTVVGNSALLGAGGCYMSTNNNCILFYNTAPTDANYDISYGGTLNYCCTTPLPTNGIANITNEPLFLNAGAGDFHLQPGSPCINSGKNSYVTNATDLDGAPRIVGGTVDIGAYEFQTPTSIISYAWLQQYGLPTDGSADFIDSDGDGMNNWKEWICGTDPTDPLSVLKMLSPSNSASAVTVSWQSVANRTYYVQRGSNLSMQPGFSTIKSNITGQAGITIYNDTNAIGAGPYFYRVGVQ